MGVLSCRSLTVAQLTANLIRACAILHVGVARGRVERDDGELRLVAAPRRVVPLGAADSLLDGGLPRVSFEAVGS